MKTLIIYATKTGTTAKCAEMLSKLIADSELYNLANGEPDISGYDNIALGGPIRMGALHPAVKRFAEKHTVELIGKNAGYFICSCVTENTEQTMAQNFPAILLENAVCKASFGGEMDPSRQKGADKLVIKLAARSFMKDPSKKPSILPKEIERFASAMLEDHLYDGFEPDDEEPR